MKLYYCPGVCSQAVHIALIEAGIEHEIEKVDLATKETESGGDYSQVNPLGYVPALELDDGDILLEAPAILQYLADLKPEANLAAAPGTRERTHLQAQLNFIATELHKSFGPFFAAIKPEGALREQAIAKLGKRFDALEARLADGRDYLMGARFSIADAYAFVVSSWAPMIGFDLGDRTRLRTYVDRIRARPKVQETLRREGLPA